MNTLGVFWSGSVKPVAPITTGGASERDAALSEHIYAEQCERFLDHWYGGRARRERLKDVIVRRSGTIIDPRASSDEGNYGDDEAPRLILSDDGKTVREEATELASISLVRKICTELGVLYASDDLERIYRSPDGEIDESTAATLGWYHHPARGALTRWLHLVDGWLPGLRTVGLLGEWCADLGRLMYTVLPPHWWEVMTHPRHPLALELAYAVAYREPDQYDADGRPIAGTVYTAYVRPALPSDPDDAPTRGTWGEVGRLVRYRKTGAGQGPWPLPDELTAQGQSEILEDVDEPDGLALYPNPFVMETEGWAPPSRMVWHPMVIHHAEPPVEGVKLPVADHLARLAEELDAGTSEAMATAAQQSYGQPVMIGPGDPPDTLGRSHVVHVRDSGGDFRFAASGGDPETHLRVVRTVAQLGASCEHLPYDLLAEKPASIETGPAIRLRRHALIQERARRIVDAEGPEVVRYELERVLHNAYGVTPKRPGIPWDTDLEMHWGELAVPVIWRERLEEMEAERRLGVSSVVDHIMERHGVSREEAVRRASLVDEDARQYAGAEVIVEGDEATDAAEPTSADVADVVVGTDADKAQDTALNGAQVEALLEVVGQAADGAIPRDTAKTIITTAFPVDDATAEKILGDIGRGFEPAAEEETRLQVGTGDADRDPGSITDSAE